MGKRKQRLVKKMSCATHDIVYLFTGDRFNKDPRYDTSFPPSNLLSLEKCRPRLWFFSDLFIGVVQRLWIQPMLIGRSVESAYRQERLFTRLTSVGRQDTMECRRRNCRGGPLDRLHLKEPVRGDDVVGIGNSNGRRVVIVLGFHTSYDAFFPTEFDHLNPMMLQRRDDGNNRACRIAKHVVLRPREQRGIARHAGNRPAVAQLMGIRHTLEELLEKEGKGLELRDRDVFVTLDASDATGQKPNILVHAGGAVGKIVQNALDTLSIFHAKINTMRGGKGTCGHVPKGATDA